MFGPAGVAYVYLVYGMYDCLNVVTGRDGSAAAVLIRAIEPLEGIDLLRLDRARVTASRRHAAPNAAGSASRRAAAIPEARLASGPGLVGAALGLDRGWTGVDLCDPHAPLRLERPAGGVVAAPIVATPRIGIAYAGEPWSSVPWRLAVAGHPSVSGPRSTR
jgi:DNA-3-methyladenine glycosylase